MQNIDLIEKINKLKKEKNAIILAHCYQNIEVDEVADYVGDSLYLSRVATNNDAKIIIFAGVYFMAETAKILSPNKKVILPRIEAGCLMADMITADKLKEFKAKYPNLPVVCYINSTAGVKAESDICCTSANAVKVLESLDSDKVLFVPDKGLGSYIDSKIEDKQVICYEGFCPIHWEVTSKEVEEKKNKYPDALTLVHPESCPEVIKLADFVGSTTAIMKYAKESNNKQFIIVTEKGVVDRLQRDYPKKEFIWVSEKAYCENMKKIKLEDILKSLETEQPEINVDEYVARKAFNCIDRMLSID